MAEDVLNKTTAEADSFAEFKEIKAGKSIPAVVAPPASDDKKPSDPPDDGDDKSSAPDGKAKAATEPPKSQKDKRSADARFSELTQQRNQERERAEKLEREIAELRASRTPAPTTPAPAPQPVAAAPPAPQPQARTEAVPERPNKQPEPKLAQYTANPKQGETYEDTQQRWYVDHAKWQQTEAAAEQQWTAAVEQDRKHLAKKDFGVAQGRAKYPDFDAKLIGDPTAMTGLVLRNEVWRSLIEDCPTWPDVLYELAKDPTEVARVSKLPAYRQMAALEKIEDRLAGNGSSALPPQGTQPAAAAPPPEQRKPPISRVSPPGHSVGGGTAGSPAQSTGEAGSYAEYKRVSGRPSARR